ncbi:hypothetical protein Tsubulata_036797, partial [Turnera subulata]
MRRATALLPATKYKFKHTNPMAGSWGTVATSTPKQRENNDSGEGKPLPSVGLHRFHRFSDHCLLSHCWKHGGAVMVAMMTE